MAGALHHKPSERPEGFPARAATPSLVALRSACRVDGAITLFYYNDVETAAQWYEDVVGFEKVLDFGWLAIFRLQEHSYLGLVSATSGSQEALDGPSKGVMVTIATSDLRAWHARLYERGAIEDCERLQVGCDGLTLEFKVRDPGGYMLEFFEWLETPPGLR